MMNEGKKKKRLLTIRAVYLRGPFYIRSTLLDPIVGEKTQSESEYLAHLHMASVFELQPWLIEASTII